MGNWVTYVKIASKKMTQNMRLCVSYGGEEGQVQDLVDYLVCSQSSTSWFGLKKK